MQVKDELEKKGCRIRNGCEVIGISSNEEGAMQKRNKYLLALV